MSRRRVVEETDRLSDLPEGILHHILSFLDTKPVVQTSVLSSKWRFVWKHVPVLNFRRSSFATDLGFVHHVEQVLSHRHSNCDVLKISTDFRILANMGLFARIMKYAASHGLQQLSLLRIVEEEFYSVFPDAIECISSCCQSLKVLELQQAYLDRAAFETLSRLNQLETLTLHSSYFDFGRVDEPLDPFANFPKLEYLQLLHCTSRSISVNPDDPRCCLKVCGPQLLYLEIHKESFDDIEISAPKLKSFTYWADVDIHGIRKGVSKWSFPSLDHADLSLWGYKGLVSCAFVSDDHKQSLLEGCVNLFHAVCNVESLSLHMDTTEILIQAYDVVKDQPSPFGRLKFLNLLYSKGSFKVPYQVIQYFLEGSLNVDDKCFVIGKMPRARKHELVAGSSVLVVNLDSLDFAADAVEEAEDQNSEGIDLDD
ncbi:unnamed protein product [Linum tenue]|uniref:F-box domain-containing protein n=1 Tax=Linum tenue TaxID=586396 RepID=A0AAV0Q3V9_9ROSI|nr:unnamed protein product [Linum tenue]